MEKIIEIFGDSLVGIMGSGILISVAAYALLKICGG